MAKYFGAWLGSAYFAARFFGANQDSILEDGSELVFIFPDNGNLLAEASFATTIAWATAAPETLAATAPASGFWGPSTPTAALAAFISPANGNLSPQLPSNAVVFPSNTASTVSDTSPAPASIVAFAPYA